MPDDESKNDESDKNWKELRKQAEEAKAHKAELEAAKREMAFVKAGVDTDSKLGKMLLRTYEGELDKESIRAEARDVGFSFADESKGDEKDERTVTDEEREAARRRDDLSSDTDNVKDEGKRPQVRAEDAFVESRMNGDRIETSAQLALEEYLRAAQAGDKRVLA
jgi:hypothetical protein